MAKSKFKEFLNKCISAIIGILAFTTIVLALTWAIIKLAGAIF